MPHFALDVPHTLNPDEATERLKAKFAAAVSEHQGSISHYQEQWRDHSCSFSFQAMGMKVRGTVAVERERVRLNAELPLAALIFKRAIESRLRQEVADLVS
jgi:hypothetical protein